MVGIVRTESELLRALEEIERLTEQSGRVRVTGSLEYNPGWHTALDLASLLAVAEAITRSALERKESRGAHFRDDHPGKDEGLAKVNVVVRKGPDGTMRIAREPIPPMRPDLKQVVLEMG